MDDFATRPEITLAIGADHGGYELKNQLVAHLRNEGVTVIDAGPHELDPLDDYPDFAKPVGHAVSNGTADCGVLLCRTGIGMSIIANRYAHVRAALATSPKLAAISRNHNCSNVLVTGGNDLGFAEIAAIIDTWRSTPFSQEERHARRLRKVDAHRADPELADILDRESERQDRMLNLIASENRTSPTVASVQASPVANKYASGTPEHRSYNGCGIVNELETLAADRACALFSAEFANVQPYSGGLANTAALRALLTPGDRILAMSVPSGGHFTHGHPANLSGQLYEAHSFEVHPQTERIDYDELAEFAAFLRPKLIIAGSSAYSRILDFPRFREIANAVGAKLLVDMAHIAGLVATGLHPSPFPHADVVTSTTHKSLRGPRGGLILARAEFADAINNAVYPTLQGGPLNQITAAKAACFHEAATADFAAYQRQVVANATDLAAACADCGLRILSGGTDVHMFTIDLRPHSVTGDVVADQLEAAGILADRIPLPGGAASLDAPDGLRIGTPALTTRGTSPEALPTIARWIADIIHGADPTPLRPEVEALWLSRRS
jgi:glycine hydroxymethyltransferase